MKSSGISISSLVFALSVIAAGVLLFAFNMGALPIEYKSVVFSWPMLLIAIGFMSFFSYRGWFFGLVLVLVGGFFLLPKIPGVDLDKQIVWAIIITALGIGLLGKVLFQRSFFWKGAKFNTHFSFGEHSDDGWKVYSSSEKGSKEYKSGYIDRNCVFSGDKEKWDLKNFKGGEVNSIFGGIELDLSDAQLAEGVHHLELNSVFGGIVLYVPIDWKIEVNKTQVFGAFVDNRPKPSFEIDENKVLIIEANAVFGGGEIKCY